MPAFANIVINDDAATPVAHTYVPRDIVNNVATFVESNGTPIGDNTVTASLRRTTNGRYKGLIKCRFPIVQTQTINGVSTPVVVRTTDASMEFTFDASSTEQERKDAVSLAWYALTGSNITKLMLTKLQGIY